MSSGEAPRLPQALKLSLADKGWRCPATLQELAPAAFPGSHFSSALSWVLWFSFEFQLCAQDFSGT